MFYFAPRNDGPECIRFTAVLLNRISCAVASEREERSIAFSTKRSVLRRRETGPNLTRIEPRASRV